ncbi:MAG: hypothetical protein ACUVQN_06535 [Caldisericia bacterium]
MDYLKHETIESIFFKKEQLKISSKILIIDPTDYVAIFDLGEKMVENGKIIVLSKYLKDFKKKVKEFGFKKEIIVIDKKIFYKIKKEAIDFIVWISPNLHDRYFLEDLSLTYRFLKNEGKLFLLFDKEMKLLNEYIIKLLHKADINETIGILEKIGYKKPFYEKSFSGKNLSIYLIIANKEELFINPFES